MTVTTTPPGPAPSAAVAPGTDPGPAAAPAPPGRLARAAHALARTPGRLRLALAVSVLACLLVGALAYETARSQADAVEAVRGGTQQVVGGQSVRADLVAADATATNAFLVGGLEPPERRAAYDASLADAADMLRTLAASRLGDGARTPLPFAALTRYTGEIEQARANNRQGYPVGAAYLDSASTSLRSDVLAPLATATSAEQARVAAAFDESSGASRALGWCALAILALVAVQVWVARRTRRVLNPWLVTATVLVLVVTAGGAVLMASIGSTTDAVRDGRYAAASAVLSAQAAANDAKSQESVGLIRRGSGPDVEVGLVESLDEARAHLADADATGVGDPALGDALDAWVDAHAGVRALDDGGDWDAAVAAASSDDPGSSNDTFAAFTSAADTFVTDTVTTLDADLDESAAVADAAAVVAVVLAALAALAAWRGIHRRLEEYR
ncbi:hypothetical protein CLV28_0070 [Sediminihabitans luteus]|uniref:Secreted protein n=1 Tax=Sediminihabitans luteus TaxID=1138585 RepID=A0A2M9CY61_9CELL|nr:hypothetical protein [Sediminihabitans luteus]PJJ76862.1 hypothetical protein CLV28_0070 [Sediminihabitans luteus]GIJ00342.1 hypothetical protein Slu03_27190 [Sediminihabitans luteus]